MPDLHDIDRERVLQRAALAAAEAAMKSGSGDARAFAKAKRDRSAALEALERLDWAEQAERERLAQEGERAKADRLREVQAAAVAAHQDAMALGAEVSGAAVTLATVLKRLREAQELVNVGVAHEAYAIREGMIQRPTVEQRVRVDREAALTILQAGRELCMLAGMSRSVADQQAGQRRI